MSETFRVPTVQLYAYVEDPPSAAIARKVISYVNASNKVRFEFRDGFPFNARGFGNIKKKVPALLKMARKGIASLIITDLDTATCPPALIREWIGLAEQDAITLPNGFYFRIAVREIESWIIADRAALANFLNIQVANFTKKPDELPDPKQHLLNVIQKKGRKRWQKEMLPQVPTAAIGPRYNEKLCSFINENWSPSRAQAISPSLARTINSLSNVFNLDE